MTSPRAAKWLRDVTPEQQQEVERLNRAADIIAPGLRARPRWWKSPEGKALIAHFDGLALLAETLHGLQGSPAIQGSPMAADFVRNVLREFDKMPLTADPSEVLATVQAPKIERGARKKVSAKGIRVRNIPRDATRNAAVEWYKTGYIIDNEGNIRAFKNPHAAAVLLKDKAIEQAKKDGWEMSELRAVQTLCDWFGAYKKLTPTSKR